MKHDMALPDGTRFETAPKTGRNWNDGTAELKPSSGNNGNNSLRTFWFGGFLFACLSGETAQLFPHAPTGRYGALLGGTGITGPCGNNSQFGSPEGRFRGSLRRTPPIERMIDEGRTSTLDELANMLFVSRLHLCSAFSRETGQGIGHYARARRMECAKTMLVGCCSVA